MKTFLFSILFIFFAHIEYAQSYTDSILHFRTFYKQEFLTDPHSPLKAEDTDFLSFYKPNAMYRVVGYFYRSPDSLPFEMQTHSGKVKMYRKYGVVSFMISKKKFSLEVYQSIDLMKKEELKDYLFIPFNDLTNYETTYGGGRYLDISVKDIHKNKVALDFNKCYNPYCAYAEGYSCPVPPVANRLQTRIEAGEKLFDKPENK